MANKPKRVQQHCKLWTPETLKREFPTVKFGYPIRVYPGAKYVSSDLREFRILPDRNGSWYVKIVFGGRLPNDLTGRFTSYAKAEAALIHYLRRTDRRNNLAKYPGKEPDGTG